MIVPISNWTDFQPSSLFRGGHAQTLAGVYLPWPHHPYRATPHDVALDDSDHVVLHDDCPRTWHDGQPAVLLVHGLAGCHTSGYMRRIADKLHAHGLRVFRMDLRGCGAGEGRARFTTHCGRTEDLAAALRYVADVCPQSESLLVGFSLGGAIALNLAAELGGSPCGNLKAILTVCPPIDLHAVKRRFDTWAGRPYDRHFARLLWRKAVRRARNVPGAPQVDRRRVPRRLYEFDQLITASQAGYASADEYYTGASPEPKLGAIQIPTQIFAAADDPIVPVQPLEAASPSSAVEVTITSSGGHLGYVARAGIDPDRRWLDWRVVQWVLANVPKSSSDAGPRSAV